MSRISKVLERYRTTYGAPKGLFVLGLRVLRLGGGTPMRAAARVGGRTRPLIRIGTSDELAYVQVFTQRDYEIELGSGIATIIDAGANVGYASIYFAERFPEARILAIEPDPENFAMLIRNTADHPQICSVQAALGETDAWVRLFDPGLGPWGIHVATADAGSSQPVGPIIKSISVPTAMELLECEVVDILKIDIEGSEREVLASPSPWIGSINAMVVEIHEGWSPGAQRAYDEASLGFDDHGKLGENRFAVRTGANRRAG